MLEQVEPSSELALGRTKAFAFIRRFCTTIVCMDSAVGGSCCRYKHPLRVGLFKSFLGTNARAEALGALLYAAVYILLNYSFSHVRDFNFLLC